MKILLHKGERVLVVNWVDIYLQCSNKLINLSPLEREDVAIIEVES